MKLHLRRVVVLALFLKRACELGSRLRWGEGGGAKDEAILRKGPKESARNDKGVEFDSGRSVLLGRTFLPRTWVDSGPLGQG